MARDLEKVYRSYSNPWARLREALLGGVHHRAIYALRGISFEIARGGSLGVVGENGAGKSTLLKMLSGVTAPSAGELSVDGRLASMLELGMGFHMELSGRQNIRLNAAMMGFSDAETEAKTPEIIAFSELGEFIDRPVKTYSSGMSMRLGFAIAAQLEPEVLIIDEALSVGDGYFQKKCMDRIRELLDGGCTFLFCSHAMYYVSTFCEHALWLRDGAVEAYGEADQVVREYEHFLGRKSDRRIQQETEAAAAGPARFDDVSVREAGSGMVVDVTFSTRNPATPVHVVASFDLTNGTQVCAFSTHRDELPARVGATSYAVRLEVPELPLQKAELDLYVYLLDDQGVHVYDQRIIPQALRIDPPRYSVGLLDPEHHWHLDVPR